MLCLPVLLCWRCSDFIDVRPENSPTYTNYFRTLQDAEALLTALQVRVTEMGWRGGIARNGQYVDDDPNEYLTNRLNLMYAQRDWAVFYDAIYQADLILDNAQRFEVKKEELAPYLQQAYFAKAVAYFFLARNFGEAPITKGSTVFVPIAQSTVSEVLDEAEKYGLKAMELAPYEEMVKMAPAQRVKQYGSKGAAAALMAYLYAWRAGLEGKRKCWELAEEYCRMIIDGETGYYKLAATPEEVCTKTLFRDGDESIWELRHDAQENVSNVRRDLDFVGFPLSTASYDLPDRTSDPMITKASVRRMYPEGDLRRDAYFWGTDADTIYLKKVNGVMEASLERGTDPVISVFDNQNIERAFVYKFRYPYYTSNDWNPAPQFEGMNQNMIIWRLADIYLLRAECRARQGKSNAVEDLNKIRSRAYGDLDINAKTEIYAFPCADDVKNGLAGNIQLAIFREREKELLQEYHRYYDIVRSGWCYLRGEDSYDYIRKEISEYYGHLTDQDIKDGALYYMVASACFVNNDMVRQNVYWNGRLQ